MNVTKDVFERCRKKYGKEYLERCKGLAQTLYDYQEYNFEEFLEIYNKNYPSNGYSQSALLNYKNSADRLIQAYKADAEDILDIEIMSFTVPRPVQYYMCEYIFQKKPYHKKGEENKCKEVPVEVKVSENETVKTVGSKLDETALKAVQPKAEPIAKLKEKAYLLLGICSKIETKFGSTESAYFEAVKDVIGFLFGDKTEDVRICSVDPLIKNILCVYNDSRYMKDNSLELIKSLSYLFNDFYETLSKPDAADDLDWAAYIPR